MSEVELYKGCAHHHGHGLNCKLCLESALAQREAQVRAEEREKARGLVEALEIAEFRLSKFMDAESEARREIRAAIAKYNENMKG